MNSFTDYNSVIFNAFITHSKQKEVVEKKEEIFSKIFEYYNYTPSNFLFIGFSPYMTCLKGKTITLTETDDTILAWLDKQKIKVKPLATASKEKFDCVIAMDEYLTFSDSDEQLKQKISVIRTVCSNLFLTSVKDYKNQDFKDREYSIPAIIKSNNSVRSFTEIHDWSINEKSSFRTFLYELTDRDSKFHGQFSRKPVYFKQLARFCSDVGAVDFLVHKNVMYKSLIKKNYEHVISVSFQKDIDN